MKKVKIEFSREADGTRRFEVYREGEKKNKLVTRSQYEAFARAQVLYASQSTAIRGVAA